MPDEKPQSHPLDSNPHAAKLAAVWHLLLSAKDDEEYAQFQKIARKILAMSAEEVMALSGGQNPPPDAHKPDQKKNAPRDQQKREGKLIQFLR